VHPRFRTPSRAIVLSAFLGIAFVLLRTFEQLADTFVIAIVPFLALAVLGVFRLRGRANYDPPFRVPGYPVVPLLFVASTIALLANAVVDVSSRVATVVVLGVVLAGLPVYALTVGRHRGVAGS
jgi:amino acid transporter